MYVLDKGYSERNSNKEREQITYPYEFRGHKDNKIDFEKYKRFNENSPVS